MTEDRPGTAPEPWSAPGPDLVPPSPPARMHRWGLGAYVLVEAVYLLTALSMLMVFGGERASVATLMLMVAAPTLLAAGLSLVITTLRGNGPRTDLRILWSPRAVGLGLLCGFGGLLLIVPASLVYISIVGPEANSAAGAAFGGVTASWPWAVTVFVLVVFVAPVCEEIVYRGLLWGAVEQRWGRWAALTVTTVLFAVAHLELTRTPLLLVIAIPIGLARIYSGSLIASIVTHQVINLLPGIVLMLSVAGMAPTA
ncbi:MAG: CPBP family intramembrane metalloprotease [Actinobacteria bacterium]|nr:CPBP family intramembrane metalloprotease [Actinomycetota bacterium]